MVRLCLLETMYGITKRYRNNVNEDKFASRVVVLYPSSMHNLNTKLAHNKAIQQS